MARGSPARDATTNERVAKLATIYLGLADSELQGYCPAYERIARAMADDDHVLRRYVDLVPRVGLIPVLLFACVHDLVLAETSTGGPAGGPAPRGALGELAAIYAGEEGDPWPPFRRVVDERYDDLAHAMRHRAVQTNEVGRTAAVLPALTAVHRRFARPLALVELGPSAGLNLFLDRYRIDYGAGLATGDPGATVRLTCERRGGRLPPLPATPLPIVRREGIDLNPLDVTDERDRRWLEACLWPGLTERHQRLLAAMDLARAEPPILHRGNATDLLAGVLDAIEPAAIPCVISTWVLGYLSPDERRAVRAVLDEFGTRRPVAVVTGEYPHVVDWLPEPNVVPPTDDPRGASLLGVTVCDGAASDAFPVAWMHAHGRWLNWFDASTAG